MGALCDAVGILGRRDLFLKTGYLLLLLGTAGAAAAALTGESAAETAAKIPDIKADLEQHETLSTAAAWLSIALTLARTHLSFKNASPEPPASSTSFLPSSWPASSTPAATPAGTSSIPTALGPDRL